MTKFYAVAVGRKPGIYLSWDECDAQVKGYTGAKFKACLSQEEAQNFLLEKSVANHTAVPQESTAAVPLSVAKRIEDICAKRPVITSSVFVRHIASLEALPEQALDSIFLKLEKYKFSDPSKIGSSIYMAIKEEEGRYNISQPFQYSAPTSLPKNSSQSQNISQQNFSHKNFQNNEQNFHKNSQQNLPQTHTQNFPQDSSQQNPSQNNSNQGFSQNNSNQGFSQNNSQKFSQQFSNPNNQQFTKYNNNQNYSQHHGQNYTQNIPQNPPSNLFPKKETQNSNKLQPNSAAQSSPLKDYFVEILCVLADEKGIYKNSTLARKMDISSRAIRVAQTLGVPSTDFLQLTFSKTPLEKIHQILSEGMILEEQAYMFLGYTNSGLLQNQAWYVRRTELLPTPHQLWQKLGDFAETSRQGAAKFGSRIGLSFAGSIKTIALLDEEWEEVDDKYAKDGTTLTDGCGEISPEKAAKICEILELDEVPSAFQIRFRGYKGVLVINRALPRGGIHVVLRKSMRKFSAETIDYNFIDVLRWSDFSTAKLSSQLIRCLLARKVPQNFFERIFDQQLSVVLKALDSCSAALDFLKLSGNTEHYHQLTRMLLAGFDPQTEPYLHEQISNMQKKYMRRFTKKPQLKIRNARYCMGVYDTTSLLPPNTVYFERGAGEKSQPYVGKVLLMRHPCYHEGDMRIVEAVDVPALHGMRNVTIFSQNEDSETSLPNMLSGGDLDGDIYCVCYNAELLNCVSPNVAPFDYQSLPKSEKGDPIPVEQQLPSLVDHYCKTQEKKFLLGKMDFAMSVWADLSGDSIGSENCKKLVRVLQLCLDCPKTGVNVTVPNGLEIPRNHTSVPHYLQGPRHSTTIFGYMYDKMQNALQNMLENTAKLSLMDPHLQISQRDPEYEECLHKAAQHYANYKIQVRSTLSKFEATENEATKISKSLKELNRLHLCSFTSMKSYEVNQISQEMKRLLFFGLPNIASKRKMACAIYEVVYQKAAHEANSNKNNINTNIHSNLHSTNSNPHHSITFTTTNNDANVTATITNNNTNNFKTIAVNITDNNTNNASISKNNYKFPYSFVWNVAVELICSVKADALAEEAGDLVGWSVAPNNLWFTRH